MDKYRIEKLHQDYHKFGIGTHSVQTIDNIPLVVIDKEEEKPDSLSLQIQNSENIVNEINLSQMGIKILGSLAEQREKNITEKKKLTL